LIVKRFVDVNECVGVETALPNKTFNWRNYF